MHREEGLNDLIKKFSKKQCTEKTKPILREPLRSLRLCVEKDVEIPHMVAGYSKTLPKKHDVAHVYYREAPRKKRHGFNTSAVLCDLGG